MFNLDDKRKYYKSRLGLNDGNKRNYARGFLDGSSCNHTSRHYQDDRKELKNLFGEYKRAERYSEQSIVLESISYVKGCMRGYEEKRKNKKN